MKVDHLFLLAESRFPAAVNCNSTRRGRLSPGIDTLSRFLLHLSLSMPFLASERTSCSCEAEGAVSLSPEQANGDEIPSNDATNRAADYLIFNSAGKMVPFKSVYWPKNDRPRRVMIIFIRNFFCGVSAARISCTTSTGLTEPELSGVCSES